MTTYTYGEKPKRTYEGYQLANLGERIFALIIDNVLLGIVVAIVFGRGRAELGFALWFLFTLAYQWYFLTQHAGQTPGKMLMKIRVVKKSGEPLSAADVILRVIGYHINSFVIMLGWLWAIFHEERRGWHDLLAGTVVVSTR